MKRKIYIPVVIWRGEGEHQIIDEATCGKCGSILYGNDEVYCPSCGAYNDWDTACEKALKK